MSEQCQCGTETYIDHRMLFDKHGGQDDQNGKDQRSSLDPFLIFQSLAVMDGKINSQGIKYMDAWQDISRGICPVDSCNQLCKDVVSREYRRAEMLNVRIDVRNNKENCHSHHQVEDQLEIFPFILIAEQEIHNCQYHIWKP